MPTEYIPIFIFAIIVAAVPATAFALARRARRNAPAPAEESNFTGAPLAFEETERRSNTTQILLVGALLVMCDAAIIFLVPWAVRMNELGVFGLAATAGFLGVLGCGYFWLYRRRALGRL